MLWGNLGLSLLESTSLRTNLQSFHLQEYVNAALIPNFCTFRLHLSCEYSAVAGLSW